LPTQHASFFVGLRGVAHIHTSGLDTEYPTPGVWEPNDDPRYRDAVFAARGERFDTETVFNAKPVTWKRARMT
jgi:hypothetical protein